MNSGILKVVFSCRFIIEDKYDGERIMIHKSDEKIEMFTRSVFVLVR